MITSTIKELPKSTVELEIHIPWEEIRETYDKIFAAVAKEFEYEGFRKGKVPAKIVAEKIDKTKLYQEVIKEIVPKAYQTVVTQQKIAPVISPKVEILKAKEKEEWLIKATVALKPKIVLDNFREKFTNLKKDKPKIWTPGASETEKKDEKITLDALIKILLESVTVELSDLLITEEANRLLASLVDQTQKLGLTVEQYLIAKGKTTEQIKAEYAQEAKKNLTVEFALAEIADKENITVTDKDLEEVLSKVQNQTERDKLRKDSYYLAHLIRQQKTIDFLYNL